MFLVVFVIKKINKKYQGLHMTHLDTFLVPVFLITLNNTPKLNKKVSQIRVHKMADSISISCAGQEKGERTS